MLFKTFPPMSSVPWVCLCVHVQMNSAWAEFKPTWPFRHPTQLCFLMVYQKCMPFWSTEWFVETWTVLHIVYGCFEIHSSAKQNHWQVKWITLILLLQCNVLLGDLGLWHSCGCHLMCYKHLKTFADPVHPLMATAPPDGGGHSRE